MKIGELRQKSKTELPKEAKVKMRTKFSSPTELQKLLSEKGERLRNLRFDLASGKVKNVREIREIKKDIARIMTILKEQSKSEKSRENPSVAEWQRGGRRSDSLLRPSRLGKD